MRRLARIALWGISGFIIGSILLVALYRYLPPPGTPLMLLRRVEGYGIHKSWNSFDQISANLVRAIIASEDTRFCNHHGFDWNAIETAWDRYRSRRGRLLGASTISMQTAKNVFLWPGRDWVRKAFEAYFTVLIEIAWGKQRIMEVYLNVFEYAGCLPALCPPCRLKGALVDAPRADPTRCEPAVALAAREIKGGASGGGGGQTPEINPIIRGLLARLPKSGDVWPEAERKLWLELLAGSFKLIYKDAPPSDGQHEAER